MTNETKREIIEAAQAYCDGRENFGINKLAKASDVSASYLSNMMRGNFTYVNSRSGEKSEIGDNIFSQLAEFIGFEVKKEYWPHVNTPQFNDILFELNASKEHGVSRMIIGESGCGKSYSIEAFYKHFPSSTYVVKCFRRDSLNDLLRKIEKAMRLIGEGSSSQRIDKICAEIVKQGRRGERAIIIFDESECITGFTFGVLKSLYDALNGLCGIVLIGTDELLSTLEKSKRLKKPGMQQFCRRFKSGMRMLEDIDRSFTAFLGDLHLPVSMQKTVLALCENYGELHDYVEPVLRASDEIGVAPSDDIFREYHRI